MPDLRCRRFQYFSTPPLSTTRLNGDVALTPSELKDNSVKFEGHGNSTRLNYR